MNTVPHQYEDIFAEDILSMQYILYFCKKKRLIFCNVFSIYSCTKSLPLRLVNDMLIAYASTHAK